jgi:hypothetical protein
MNLFYVVEIINELTIIMAGTAAALAIITCSVFSFPKDES